MNYGKQNIQYGEYFFEYYDFNHKLVRTKPAREASSIESAESIKEIEEHIIKKIRIYKDGKKELLDCRKYSKQEKANDNKFYKKLIMTFLIMVCVDCATQKQLKARCTNNNCNLASNFQDYKLKIN